jgi:Flp pilus assembly pilin Flp
MNSIGMVSDERGTTAVEFALAAPLFALVFGGVLATGLAMWTQVSLQRAVEAAARCAVVNRLLCGDENAVRQYAASRVISQNIPPSSFQVTPLACGIEVRASYAFTGFAHADTPAWLAIGAQYCYPN